MVEVQNQQVSLPDEILAFFNENFIFNTYKGYKDVMAANFEVHPYRNNQSYIAYYKRIMLMAAQFGFQEVGAHANKFKSRSDPFHPLSLLATGSYLGGINYQAS